MPGRNFNFWTVIRQVRQYPDEYWEAHCLNVGVVTYGDTLRHALNMIHEAVTMFVTDELKRGANPRDNTASSKDWDEFGQLVKNDIESFRAIQLEFGRETKVIEIKDSLKPPAFISVISIFV